MEQVLEAVPSCQGRWSKCKGAVSICETAQQMLRYAVQPVETRVVLFVTERTTIRSNKTDNSDGFVL
jgi:hypothetical protein